MVEARELLAKVWSGVEGVLAGGTVAIAGLDGVSRSEIVSWGIFDLPVELFSPCLRLLDGVPATCSLDSDGCSLWR